MSEPPASRSSLFRSSHKMYKNQQEDAEDSTNSSFWSDKETEDEEDEVRPGFKTKVEPAEEAKEDVKSSDSEEVIERFVEDDLKSKEVSHDEETSHEEFGKEQNATSKCSENDESDDSWEECGSDEGEIEEGMEDEDVSGQAASRDSEIQNLNESRKIEESFDVSNTSDEDETDNWRKADNSGTGKERCQKWKEFSDDSSKNEETSSEDEVGTRPRRKSSGNLDKCDSNGRKGGKCSGSGSENPESSRQISESPVSNSLDGEKATKTSSDHLKTCQSAEEKEEMAKTTESEFRSSKKSSDSIRSDSSESDFEKENQFDFSEEEDGKSKVSSQDGEDYNGKGDLEQLPKTSEDSLKSDSHSVTQTSSENVNSESEFTEGSVTKSSCNDVESGGNTGKRLRKQDNFYDRSESADISSGSSNGQNRTRNRDEITIEKSTAEEKTVKKCKVFSEDGSEDDETDDGDDDRPKAEVEEDDDNDQTFVEVGGNKIDFRKDNTVGNESCEEKEKTRQFIESEANPSNAEGDCGDSNFKPSVSRQISQSTRADDLTKDEEKLNNSQLSLDFDRNITNEGNIVKEDCQNIERFTQKCSAMKELKAAPEKELGGFMDPVSERTCLNAEKDNCKNSSKVVEESLNQEMSNKQMDFDQESGNLHEETLSESSHAVQKNLESENTTMGVSKVGQGSCNIEKHLEESLDDDEEIERWFTEAESEIIHRNASEGQDLDKITQDDNQTTSESPAVSLMTSGYGTIRSEKPNTEDDRLTIHEFDKDSLYSFGVCEQEAGEIPSLMRSYQDNEGQVSAQDEFWDGRKSENGVEGKEGRRLEAQLCLEKGGSSEEEEDEGNKDIKFIDSKVDARQQMYQEWEGNLRRPTEGASGLEESLNHLHLSTSAQHESESETLTSHSESPSSESLSEGAFESYVRGMSRSHSDGDIRPRPKSFIRPRLGPTGPKKTDPVAKYFQYKQLWAVFKTPGENDRKDLRWEIRERLACQPPPPKPRKVLVPNTYTVPTEKKRSALRWEIRNDLATGNRPLSYRF